MSARALPIVRYRGKRWFLDERLSELRDIHRPWRKIDLSPDVLAALGERGTEG